MNQNHISVIKREACATFSAPLDTLTEGRLLLTSPITALSITASPEPSELYSAHFVENIPLLRTQDGIVSLHYWRPCTPAYTTSLVQPLAKVALNSTIPWEIEFRSALTHLDADLSELNVRAIDMTGVCKARLHLPYPQRLCSLYCSGNVSGLTILRPPGVTFHLHISGKSRQLLLDGSEVASASPGFRWQSGSYDNYSQRFEVKIAGNVDKLCICCGDMVKQSDGSSR